MRTIALYMTETMADWEYAYLTTQIVGVEQLRPGRFRLLLVGDGLESVCTFGNPPLMPEADLDALDVLTDDGSLAAPVIFGGDHYAAGHDRLIEAVGHLVNQEIPVAAICGATLLLVRGGFLDERRHTLNVVSYLGASGYHGGAHYVETPVVTDRGATTASGTHAVPSTAKVMRISEFVLDATADAWEQVFLSAREDDYMTLMEATVTWQNSQKDTGQRLPSQDNESLRHTLGISGKLRLLN